MFKAHLVPEGPGSELDATGETPELAVRAAYRAYLTWAHRESPSEEDVDDYLKDVEIRNGAIYDGGMPCGDVGPA